MSPSTTNTPRFLALSFIVLHRYRIFFKQIEGLWPPYVEQVSWHYFSNSICSLHVSVSHF